MNPLTLVRQIAVFQLQALAGACDFLTDLIEKKADLSVVVADWEFPASSR